MIERLFKLRENNTDVKTEAMAGLTSFVTASYIIFVQPAILKAAGVPFEGALFATCVASAAACLLMGLLANYPIILAPAMGHNFFFAFTVCGSAAIGGYGYGWQTGLGAVFISGCIFIALSLVGFRVRILHAIPDCLKHSIAAGIGLLIALLGLWWGGLIKRPAAETALLQMGQFHSPVALLCFFGLAVTGALMALRVKGAILWGILVNALVALACGLAKFEGILGKVPNPAPTFLALDIRSVFTDAGLLSVIFVFFFLDLFDTVGTLVGVADRAGFLKDGELPRARQAFLSDAAGTVIGACLGTSTITSYIESAAGVMVGGRTGLANMFTALCFLLALFFKPLVQMVGGGVPDPEVQGLLYYPILAPALIVVGSLMMASIARVKWDDPTEALPAFLTAIVMMGTLSITEGIAVGFISYAVLKLVARQGRQVHWIIYLFAVLFILRYVFLAH